MIYYVDIRFEVEADSSREAVDLATRETAEIFDENFSHRLGPLLTTPYVIAVTAADTTDNTEINVDSW